jgi:hypothetical protein
VSETERAWSLGGSRWSVLFVVALIGAGISLIGGMWIQALLFFAAAVVLGAVALRVARR